MPKNSFGVLMNRELVKVAATNLRHQGLRSYLTLLGIIIGIASIFALISIGQGLQQATTEQFEQLGSNTIFVAPGGSFSSGNAPRSEVRFSDADIKKLESFSEVQNVIPFFSTNYPVKYAGSQASAIVLSFDPVKTRPLEDTGIIEVQEGRVFNDRDVFTALIGANFAEKGFTRELKPKSVITINNKKFTVVGILKASAQTLGSSGPNTNNTIFITERAAKLTFSNYQPGFMFAQTFSKDQVNDAKDKIQRYFDKKYGKDTTSIQTSEQLLEQVNQFLGIVSLFLIIIASISLIVGGIGIMNAMVMTVLERTKEIGTMKAVGATNSTILSMFLIEAGLIGLVGGLIGSLLGFGFAQIASSIAQSSGINLKAVATPELFLFVLGFSMLVGMISGVWPAWRAAQMDPVEALRYE